MSQANRERRMARIWRKRGRTPIEATCEMLYDDKRKKQVIVFKKNKNE